jgi:hypothetical protein
MYYSRDMKAEWITKEEAERRCTVVASSIPGARMVRYPTSRQVRNASNHITVCYDKVYADAVKKNPES